MKKKPVLVIAAAIAILSMAMVPPGREYMEYMDVRVLCLLFCLMLVVAGLQECGLFVILAGKLLAAFLCLPETGVEFLLSGSDWRTVKPSSSDHRDPGQPDFHEAVYENSRGQVLGVYQCISGI